MSFGPNCPLCGDFACECAMYAVKGDILLAIIVVVVILGALGLVAVLR